MRGRGRVCDQISLGSAGLNALMSFSSTSGNCGSEGEDKVCYISQHSEHEKLFCQEHGPTTEGADILWNTVANTDPGN